jgi:CHASE1-domain containing sensor protein
MDKPSLRHVVILGFVVGCGIGLSAIAALFVNRWEVSRQHTRFQQQIENLTITLQRSLNRYTDLLSFLSDHYRVSQGQVSRQDFEQFVTRSLQVYPGIQALEWAPVVPQGDRLAFEQTVQGEGFSTFQIQELGAR